MEEKINQLVQDRAPWLLNGSFLSKTIYSFLKKFLKFGETIYVGDHIQGMTGAEAFNWLGSEYTSNCEIEGLENIPKDGKCLLVANHPMGAADAVSLYHQIFKVREDVFFFANELFVYLLGSFKDVMAPVVWNKEKEIHSATKVTLERLNTFFGDERIGGIWDRPWEKTPITLAKKYNFPVVPVYIDAKNSWFFYFASYANKQLRDVSQLNELLNKKEYKFTIKIGKPIKHTDLSSHNDIAIQQLRYKSESLKKGFFKLKRFLYLRQYKN
jgi:putative hemolysin